MSRYTNREDVYNKIPLSLNANRQENLLIDILGNWIPECDVIYYGLLNSDYSEKLYKLKNTSMFDPYKIYMESCYFSGSDLIRYLASPNDDLIDLSSEYLEDAYNTAISKYSYVPCNETMLRHSIIELSYFNFIDSITLVFPWDIREIDYQYLKAIIPDSVIDKFKIVTGDILGFLETKSNVNYKYTTIISNSLSDINKMIDECDKYRTDESFFLLRNHSENVMHEIIPDQENPENKIINFKEIGTLETVNKLMDIERGIPKTKMRFARYEPELFEVAKPSSDSDFLAR